MKNKEKDLKSDFSIFCWNIANPSIERAEKQADWLGKRSEDILILTEAKDSSGCTFLEKYFKSRGHDVIFSRPEGREFGVIMVSKHPLITSKFSTYINFLQARVVSAKLNFPIGEIEIIGTYVPSRDSSPQKIAKKKRFLKDLTSALSVAPKSSMRIFCGDLNILESGHSPHYSFFKDWEYDFYRNLEKHQLKDAFRQIYPSEKEYSWVGRTGDSYRYDHSFVSENISPLIKKCFYSHEPREKRLSDHSAVITELNLQIA